MNHLMLILVIGTMIVAVTPAFIEWRKARAERIEAG